MAHRPVRGGGRRDLGGPEHQPGPGGRPDSHGAGRCATSCPGGGRGVRDRGDRLPDGGHHHFPHRQRRTRPQGCRGCRDRSALCEVDAVVGSQAGDRVDLWVAKHDPDAVRVPPNVKDNRFVDIGEISPGMAGIYGHLESPDAALLDATLDALADTVCDNDPRTKEQRRADALGPLSRRESTLACRCGSDDCAAVTERRALSEVVINVLAEQATVNGTSNQPGYLPGFGILPAESVRELAAAGATMQPLTMPSGSAPGYRASKTLAKFIRWRDLTCRFPGCDARAADVRHRPHQALSVRADPSVEHQALLPHSSSAENVLRRVRLERTAVPRRHHHVDGTHGAHLQHPIPRRRHVSRIGPTHRRPGRHHRPRRIPAPRRDDAHPQTDPRTRPPRPHHPRTPPTQRTRHSRRAEAVGMASPPTKNHHRSRAAHLSARRPTCPDCSARRRQGTTAPSSAIRRRRLRGADRRCAR